MRKLCLCVLIAVAVLTQCALAEEEASPMPKVASFTLEGDSYLEVGEEAVWTTEVTGGTGGDYTFRYWFTSLDENGETKVISITEIVPDNVFRAVIPEEGYYRVLVDVRDGGTGRVQWQSKVYSTANIPEDYSDPNTVPGKIEQLAAQCKQETDGTMEAEIKWMHDWLLENAVYDEALTIYSPDGVLLKGIGVCSSYALAFELFCDRMGIPCEYASGHNHAWNTVTLNGERLHIDCTWDDLRDDPYQYYLVSQEVIEEDHYDYTVPEKASEAVYEREE